MMGQNAGPSGVYEGITGRLTDCIASVSTSILAEALLHTM